MLAVAAVQVIFQVLMELMVVVMAGHFQLVVQQTLAVVVEQLQVKVFQEQVVQE